MAIELGDPIPGATRKRKRPKLKVVEGGKRKRRAKPVMVDLASVEEVPFAEDPPRAEALPNAMGLDGVENPTLAFVARMTGLQKAKRKIASDIGTVSKAAKNEGVPVKAALRVIKELRIDADEFIDDMNLMNQIRALVSLPHGERLEPESKYTNDKDRDEVAYRAGRRHCWRGGRESDNPYADDQERGQAWLKGYGDAYAEGVQASSSAAMSKATQKP